MTPLPALRQKRGMPLYKNVPVPKRSTGSPAPAILGKLFVFLWQRRMTVLAALVGVILIPLGVAGVRFYQGKRAEKVDAVLVARMTEADKAIQDGEWDRAIQYYEEVIPRTGQKKIFRVAALQNMALAYLKKGELEKGLEALERIQGDDLNPDYTKLLRAYLLEKKGDREEALRIYGELSKEASIPELRPVAEAREKWLSR